MNKRMNDIYVRRASKIVLDKFQDKTDKKLIATAMKNIESLGFALSKQVIDILSKYGDNRFLSFYKEFLSTLKSMVGANHKFAPMYPNFPKQVMDATETELYINAITHYFGDWVGLRILPVYEKEKRLSLVENTKLTVIGVGDEDDFISLMKNLVSSKTSISETDKTDLSAFLREYQSDMKNVLPNVIPNKEVLAFVAKNSIAIGVSSDVMVPYFKTATDVLRLAVAMSGGDISLAKRTKFRNFSRPERRFLISLIDKSGKYEQITEDILRFKGYWKKLGEKLHFGDYSQFKNVIKAMDIVRNDKVFQTTNSKIEKAISDVDIKGALEILIHRPGDLARKLDQILRQRKNMTIVVKAFESVVSKVSTPVLFQLIAHFKNRTCDGNRVIMPKGNLAKLVIVPKMVGEITKVLCNRIVRICRDDLKARYSKLEPLGKVYVDKDLENYLIPFSQRSASRALKTIVRGSRVKMDGKNFIRFFLWWKQPKDDRIDIDLSASFYDKDFNHVWDTSYWNLRNEFSSHSGDITSAPKGACEFIDIDISKAKKFGVKYVVQSIFSYTQQKYYDIPECFAGFMTRDDQNNGQIFDARTVQNKYDITSDNHTVIPMVFDIETNEMIWTDLGNDNERYVNNAISNRNVLNDSVKGIITMKKANLLDLLGAHAESRGTIVSDPEKADTVFAVDTSKIKIKDGAKVITPFDIEAIMGQYL